MNIKASVLRGLDLPWSAIEDKIIGASRWSIQRSIVFKYEGKFYSATYSVGATEMQDERPWEYQDEVECVEVEQQLVTTLMWVEI